MPTQVVMPEIGESVVSGTIVKWLKQLGEEIKRDEPLVEISTDKANVEIPSPGEGVLRKILAEEGDQVEVGGLLAIIAAPDEAIEEEEERPAKPQPKEEKPAEKKPPKKEEPKRPEPAAVTEKKPVEAEKPTEKKAPPKEEKAGEEEEEEAEAAAERRRERSSPLVRRMAKEHGVNLDEIEGSGLDGRVTKEDLLDYIARKEIGEKAPPARPPKAEPAPRPAERPAADLEEIIPLEGMRKAIAEHMIRSKQTSAHVTTVAEVDMSALVALREKNKEAFRKKYGISLTYLAFVINASVQALKEFPYMNCTLKEDKIILKRYYNIGISVQTERGLMTPVIPNADRLTIEELALRVDSVARRAREGRLSLAEITGGTFSITNAGFYDALLSTPIINQPQAAILGVEKMEKRAVVIDDAIAIRPMMYLCLSYDHRIVDGATSIQFLQRIRSLLEAGKFDIDVCL
jgi:2-oxoglutarate dehydrogenase dihydrolipoamide succinyltransferase (E2 component)